MTRGSCAAIALPGLALVAACAKPPVSLPASSLPAVSRAAAAPLGEPNQAAFPSPSAPPVERAHREWERLPNAQAGFFERPFLPVELPPRPGAKRQTFAEREGRVRALFGEGQHHVWLLRDRKSALTIAVWNVLGADSLRFEASVPVDAVGGEAVVTQLDGLIEEAAPLDWEETVYVRQLEGVVAQGVRNGEPFLRQLSSVEGCEHLLRVSETTSATAAYPAALFAHWEAVTHYSLVTYADGKRETAKLQTRGKAAWFRLVETLRRDDGPNNLEGPSYDQIVWAASQLGLTKDERARSKPWAEEVPKKK